MQMIGIPKPLPRPKKQPKPLKRTPIKSGSKCIACAGTGKNSGFQKAGYSVDIIADNEPCPLCNGTGRFPSKPIARSFKPIERNEDKASFDPETLRKVWGRTPRCPLTGFRADTHQIDAHHICGRLGGDAMASSPYNSIMLCREIHVGGFRDHPEMRALFLNIASEKVTEAIIDRRYKPTATQKKRDRAFLDYAEQFIPSFPSRS